MRKGIALILVVSILTVVAITVVSFIFTMRLESRAAANYLWQEKAGYIAEAGIVHALAVLKEDKEDGFLDSYSDPWRTVFSGSDIDNNDDRKMDSRWIQVKDAEGEVVGRYAVLVEDELGKVNINTAGFHNESPLKATQGASTFEVSLKDFLEQKGVSGSKAQAIIDYRFGADGGPGEAGSDDNLNQTPLIYDGIDNDADGDIDEAREGIDEPQEFIPERPFGDDRPFLSTAQLKQVGQISQSEFNSLRPDITAYSQSASTDRNRQLQWDVNSLDAQQLLDALLRSGLSGPWRKAVNIVDFADSDFAQSAVMMSSLPLYTRDMGPNGDWRWAGYHYESKTYGGIKGVWTWTGIDAGEYFLVVHGSLGGRSVGDVTFEEVTQPQMRSGETFNIFPSGTVTIADAGGGQGSLTLAIQNNESLGTTCYFKYVELISAEGRLFGETHEVRGTEGIRINELMAQPIVELVATGAQSPGGDWVWQGNYYHNGIPDGGPQGEGTWIWQDIPDGEYYLTVYGASSDQLVGDVLADGTIQENMRSGDRFSAHTTVSVSGGLLRLGIQNNLSEGICYFKSATLSQQPDAEYIELVNLTPNQVSLGGWSLEVTGTDGWPASIPLGTTIEPLDYLILAVDKEDSCAGIHGNGISFEDVWGPLGAAQLDFTRSLTEYSDMIDDAPLAGVGEIILRDASGNIVDIQEYSSGQLSPYRSLEKADPTALGEPTEIWFPSEDLSGGTPAKKNDNYAMIEEIKQGQVIEHTLDEVQLRNGPFANLGEIALVTTGERWAKMGIDDLWQLADRLAVSSLRLEAEEHLVEEEEEAEGGWEEETAWKEQLRPAPQTSWFLSENNDEVSTWLWGEDEFIPNGVYTLYLYGQHQEAVSVSVHLADDTWTAFTPPLTPGANNGVCFGRIQVGPEKKGTGTFFSLPAHKIEMRVKNVSASQIAHFDYIRLSPLPYVAGKVNINTASPDVLRALPMIDDYNVQKILELRPLGNWEEKARGIGDILYNDLLHEKASGIIRVEKFSALSNLITVRSDVYQIIATGQALRNGRVMAEKRIRAIVER